MSGGFLVFSRDKATGIKQTHRVECVPSFDAARGAVIEQVPGANPVLVLVPVVEDMPLEQEAA